MPHVGIIAPPPATFAILKTFGFADFNKKQLTRAYHAQNRGIKKSRDAVKKFTFPGFL